MPEERPDPDALLMRIRAEEARARHGRLRIFFGACAGVGKTYAMLEAAQAAAANDIDVVAGYVEPHGRIETERLIEGLERLPTRPVRYRGIVRQEFDLDAALRRHPATLLVDELAHSNLTGGDPEPRHPKRWQDIEELIDAGVDVWTTVNIQHLESLNDVVAQITGVIQRETLPDRIFDEADEVELIDLPPDDLLERLHAGKVYIAEEVGTAVERFFRKSNLVALRELALRRMADRVEAAARTTLVTDGTSRPWLARDRVLVGIGPDDQAEQVVRAGKRIADGLNAEWSAVYVETPALLRLSEKERDRRIDLLRLAESLGAETVTLDGPTAAQALLEYAETRKATRVVVGAPKRRGWRAWLRPSTTTALVQLARGFDVLMIAAPDRGTAERAPVRAMPSTYGPRTFHKGRYVWALIITGLCTGVASLMHPHLDPTNLVMVYLLGVTVAGLNLGRGPTVLAALCSVAAFDFFFVSPHLTFAVSDAQYLLTFAVMLFIAFVIAHLMASVRQQTRVAGARERRTALLYAMSRELAATQDLESMAGVAVRHVAEVFDCQVVVMLPDATGRLGTPFAAALPESFRSADLAVAQWVLDHGRAAGLGTDTLTATPGLYLPMKGSSSDNARQQLGVLAVLPVNRRRVLLPEQRRLLETFASQIGLALERARLAETAEATRVAAKNETLRNTLLASISHDLRTPLAVMAGAAGTLVERGPALDEETRASLAGSIEVKAREMSELISNVLDLMRFEAGEIALRLDWQTLDDLVGSALQRLGDRLAGHPIEIHLGSELPPVYVDAALVVQVFGNLFDNIAKYTPPGTRAQVFAAADESSVRVTVGDEGPGLPPGDPQRLFDKFQRGNGEDATPGAGLGLAICRAIVCAHGGEIAAHRRPCGGARFEFTLPAAGPGT